jgi:hypothetical protein
MSLLVRPMNQPDDLDPLLRRFFKSELPAPWPACPTPAEPARLVVAEKPAASWLELSQRFASRFALALSLLLFVGAAWGLSEMFLNPRAPVGEVNPTAVLPIELQNPSASRFKVNEHLVQPKDGATQIQIEIHEFVPPPKR